MEKPKVMHRHRNAEAGQVLVIFAFGLVGILAIAALVFDVGQDLVERRNQQKAADAAALAGARYLTTDTCKAAYTLAACPEAEDAAKELATRNGYIDEGTVDVEVKIPPGPESNFHNQPGNIQVTLTVTRATFFAGVLGITNTRVSTIAVARNASELSVAHSMIALSKTACQAAKFGGNGTVNVGGSIQVDSSCSTALFGAGGNVVVHAPACFVVGGYQYNVKSDVDCDYPGPGLDPPVSGPGVEPAGDPLGSLRGPSLAGAGSGAAVKVESGSGTPDNCPIWRAPPLPPDTTNAGTMENPKTCKFTNGNTTYRLYPGVYWGGIAITGKAGMVIYMEPGIYYLAGGGFSITGGDLTLRTVNPGGMSNGGGILLYNTDDPYFRTVCADPTYVSPGCIGAIKIAGTGSATDVIHLEPYEYDPYKNILIYQDRYATSQPDLDISGEGRILEMSGTIYLPEANVKVAGNGDSIAVQIIADTWDVTGNGELNITYDADSLVKFRGTGLVQ